MYGFLCSIEIVPPPMDTGKCYVIFIIKYIPVRLRGTVCHSRVPSTMSTAQVPDRIRIQFSSPTQYIENTMMGRETDRPGGRAGRRNGCLILFYIYSDVILHLVSSCHPAHRRILTNGHYLTSLRYRARRTIDAPSKGIQAAP